ncbi:hypothetical protein F5X97DRAFT_310771 [Nemania serpens]|nr:hypothetical protein F5X97DRAFT_310771 [Nemania serpens]
MLERNENRLEEQHGVDDRPRLYLGLVIDQDQLLSCVAQWYLRIWQLPASFRDHSPSFPCRCRTKCTGRRTRVFLSPRLQIKNQKPHRIASHRIDCASTGLMYNQHHLLYACTAVNKADVIVTTTLSLEYRQHICVDAVVNIDGYCRRRRRYYEKRRRCYSVTRQPPMSAQPTTIYVGSSHSSMSQGFNYQPDIDKCILK